MLSRLFTWSADAPWSLPSLSYSLVTGLYHARPPTLRSPCRWESRSPILPNPTSAYYQRVHRWSWLVAGWPGGRAAGQRQGTLQCSATFSYTSCWPFDPWINVSTFVAHQRSHRLVSFSHFTASLQTPPEVSGGRHSEWSWIKALLSFLLLCQKTKKTTKQGEHHDPDLGAWPLTRVGCDNIFLVVFSELLPVCLSWASYLIQRFPLILCVSLCPYTPAAPALVPASRKEQNRMIFIYFIFIICIITAACKCLEKEK